MATKNFIVSFERDSKTIEVYCEIFIFVLLQEILIPINDLSAILD